MRIAPLLALAALAACTHNMIPGTTVPDEPQNRAVLQVLANYKQAMEARDPEGLRKSLPRDFGGVRSLKLDIDVRNLKIDGDSARVDYFGVMRYAVALPTGEKWFTESDDQRMKFVKVDGDWKISSGM